MLHPELIPGQGHTELGKFVLADGSHQVWLQSANEATKEGGVLTLPYHRAAKRVSGGSVEWVGRSLLLRLGISFYSFDDLR